MTMESADMILNIALGLIALGVFFGIAFIVWNRPDTGERTPAQSASPDEGFFEDEPASPETFYVKFNGEIDMKHSVLSSQCAAPPACLST